MAILKFDLLMTVARMNEEADKFIEEYTKKYSGGGGGDSAPAQDRTGTDESENGTEGKENTENGKWILSMKLKMPKSKDVKSLNESVEPANNLLDKLQKNYPDKEIGYFLRHNTETNELWADFFVGIDGDTWLDLSKNPYGSPLGKDEMIIGFVHTHIGVNSGGFGPDDLITISNFSLGGLDWANVPKMAIISYEERWGYQDLTSIKVIHSNPSTVDKLYFGVFYSTGYDSFSWKLTNSQNLGGLYRNIWYMGGLGSNFIKYPSNFGADYNKKKR